MKSSRKLSARMDSEVVDAFKLFDRDQDGRVTREEIVDLIESLEGDSNCPHVQVNIKFYADICNLEPGALCLFTVCIMK